MWDIHMTFKKKNQHTDISNLKRFEQIELQAKQLNYFSGSKRDNVVYWKTKRKIKDDLQ